MKVKIIILKNIVTILRILLEMEIVILAIMIITQSEDYNTDHNNDTKHDECIANKIIMILTTDSYNHTGRDTDTSRGNDKDDIRKCNTKKS